MMHDAIYHGIKYSTNTGLKLYTLKKYCSITNIRVGWTDAWFILKSIFFMSHGYVVLKIDLSRSFDYYLKGIPI